MIIGDSGSVTDWYVVFIIVMALIFGAATILAGIFTAWFGAGKSRKIGAALIVLGGLVLALFLIASIRTDILGLTGTPPLSTIELIKDAAVYIIAAVVGIILALGLFLVAIMKS